MTDENPPPKAKYRYTLEITGNSHEEVFRELSIQVNGGYLLDSEYETRDEFLVYGGTTTRRLEHANPSQTRENYLAELKAWSAARNEARTARAGEDTRP